MNEQPITEVAAAVKKPTVIESAYRAYRGQDKGEHCARAAQVLPKPTDTVAQNTLKASIPDRLVRAVDNSVQFAQWPASVVHRSDDVQQSKDWWIKFQQDYPVKGTDPKKFTIDDYGPGMFPLTPQYEGPGTIYNTTGTEIPRAERTVKLKQAITQEVFAIVQSLQPGEKGLQDAQYKLVRLLDTANYGIHADQKRGNPLYDAVGYWSNVRDYMFAAVLDALVFVEQHGVDQKLCDKKSLVQVRQLEQLSAYAVTTLYTDADKRDDKTKALSNSAELSELYNDEGAKHTKERNARDPSHTNISHLADRLHIKEVKDKLSAMLKKPRG